MENPVNAVQNPVSEASFQIPFDLFVSKKHKGLGVGGFFKFTDSFGNLVFKVERQAHESNNHANCVKLLLDASGNTHLSVHRVNKGSWRGFKGNGNGEEDLVFRVERTVDAFTRTEFEILLIADNSEDSKTEFKMKGCPFKRSCTIYKGDSIVAETSLMYKLGIKKAFVPRSRFRVTIFPGFTDCKLVVALIVVFFDGRKLWI